MPGYEDFDIYGREHEDGTPFYFHDDEALNNALISWLTSKKGDYIRYPYEGGILDTFVFKNMSTTTLDQIQFTLTNAILRKFSNQMVLNKMNVIPDRALQTLQIDIYYTSLLTNKANLINLYIDAFPEIIHYNYQSVSYVTDTLYNFVVDRKESMSGKKLIYNIVQEAWVWGKFKLTNLTTSDSRFADILSYINT